MTIHLNMPEAEYRAAPGYGSTSLKWFIDEVPAQAHHWVTHPEDAPTFDAAQIGTLVHALILGQPHPFIVKDWDARTKEGKERAAEVAAEGLVPISADDYQLATGCAEGCLRNPTVKAILERPGHGECSVFADIDGVQVKARFDWLPEPSDRRLVALDFKTAWSAHPRKFVKNVANFDYAVQHAHYLDVLNASQGPMPQEPELLFVAIDKRPPHLTALVGIPDHWAQTGRELAAHARKVIARCQTSGDWPDYGPGIHYLEMPTWYFMAASERIEQEEA